MPLAITYGPKYLWSSLPSSGVLTPKKIRYGCVTTPPIEELSLPNTMKSPSSLLWPWDCALPAFSVCPGTGDWRHLCFVGFFYPRSLLQKMFCASLLNPLSWDFYFCCGFPLRRVPASAQITPSGLPASPLALGMTEGAWVSVSHRSAKNELNIFSDVESLFILLEYYKDDQSCWVRQLRVLCLFEWVFWPLRFHTFRFLTFILYQLCIVI